MAGERDWTKEEFDVVSGGFTEEEIHKMYGDSYLEKIADMIRANRKTKARGGGCIQQFLPKDHPLRKGWAIFPVRILRPDDKQK